MRDTDSVAIVVAEHFGMSRAMQASLFSMADADGDGKISLDEFVPGFTTLYKLAQLANFLAPKITL